MQYAIGRKSRPARIPRFFIGRESARGVLGKL
jgi:hypothetical protein